MGMKGMAVCENCGLVMKRVYHNLRRREKTDIYRCPACKLTWAPELNINISFQSRLDEENRERALKRIRLEESAQVNKLIEKYVQRGGTGLDVGCAYGWYMKSASNLYEMEGIEPEDSVAEKARAAGYRVYTGFFPGDMPDNAGKYDFLVFNNVWEHINHTSKLIKKSVGFLKCGGIMVITVPLITGGLYKISELFEKMGRTKELVRLWQLHFHSPHVYYFTKKNISELMEKHNCRLLECQNVKGIDPKRMKERFEMDEDEKYGTMKARLFQFAYPFIERFPADKAVFVFRYEGMNERVGNEK